MNNGLLPPIRRNDLASRVMCESGFSIRPCTLEDARAIAIVHVESFRSAYQRTMPQTVLDAISVDEKERMWLEVLGDTSELKRVWAADVQGRIVGFGSSGLNTEDGLRPEIAEVYTLYVQPAVMGRGIGRALFAKIVDELESQHFAGATLWVLVSNLRARRFYEAAGWTSDGTVNNLDLWDEIRYRRLFAP